MDRPLAGGDSVDLSQDGRTRASQAAADSSATSGLEGMAAAAAQKAAADPRVQQAVAQAATTAATEAGSVAFRTAQARVARGAGDAMRYIQLGGFGISLICTLTALTSAIVALISIIVGFVTVLTGKWASYILNWYQLFFGLAAMLLEVDLDHLSTLPCLGKFEPCIGRLQQVLHREFHALAGLRGRGFFYLFMGVLGLVQWNWDAPLTFICGLLNLFSGVLCIVASCRAPPSQADQAANAAPAAPAEA